MSEFLKQLALVGQAASGVFLPTNLLIVAGALLFLRKKRIPRLPFIGLMLMLGGAAGNMADRLITGFVPDMIELLFVRFAVFNPADAALTVGCALIVLHLLSGKDRPADPQ